ncbi:unnamed protein product [Pseudo-nitzschia multistriata]|uniref:DUF493 domain-containing protein n=1 Tax=Pseudo-nitzschia multistriata TaxID=183589 RepID=A0A448ZMJ3_9STRA|nr:unnamed protein product [Pseudo-nitzschia multistriata]
MTKRTRSRAIGSVCAAATGFLLLSACSGPSPSHAFSVVAPSTATTKASSRRWSPPLGMADSSNAAAGDDDADEASPEAPAGSFFHPVAPSGEEAPAPAGGATAPPGEKAPAPAGGGDDFDDAVSKLMQQRRKKPLASEPSTIKGVPTKGFGKQPAGGKKRAAKPISPYVAIGTPDQPVNDPSKPERDDQGYTLYTDTKTGEKSRVFEALVDYPSVFTMKIVGANEGTFVSDMVALVAEACDTEPLGIQHTTKVMGKWVSVTVKAPVENAEMLYTLYEKVDLDPRVKFKF